MKRKYSRKKYRKSGVSNVFKSTVESIPEISSGYCRGLSAFKGNDASHIMVADTGMIDGSVDIDSCVSSLYPEDSRWDYVLGYGGKAYFVEVHPASATNDIDDMIKKAVWLKKWLKEKGAGLLRLPANNSLYWIPSGKYNLLPGAPQSKKLAQHNIIIKKPLRLPI